MRALAVAAALAGGLAAGPREAGAAGAAGVAAAVQVVEVELLSGRPARTLTVEGTGGRWSYALGDDGRLLRDGRPVPAPQRLPAGRWRVTVPAPAERTFEGALELRPGEGRLRVVATLPLEGYVAWAVASETEPGMPAEALKAQAVVARSYALAGGRRHPDVDRCDLAHCQVLRARPAPHHLAQAQRAARATAGEVLRLTAGAAAGTVAAAPFHAACGGHTADPRLAFGGEGTGAAAVADDGCPARPWRAAVPAAVFGEVVRARLGAPAPPEALDWRRGPGGWIGQVALGDRVAGGEPFARALDGRLGHRAVRSARFTARSAGGEVWLEGSGLGHGVGLCQAGAARRAAAGQGYREILGHYFPLARVAPLGAPLPERRAGGAASRAQASAATSGQSGFTAP